ncbi:DUF418 domain-containing protein [Paenibacillus methanolicus]|uniref:DUF418 domain-containing protein n=1 Tax=Paenibacillus methanolicus TaxID=582686 RepID=A0A5S5CBP2_9BACL|nr:DUF418 domain-containing protein [Paenibacillus methanolicus]TYP76774.1 uncharacterized protein BCM02_103438 [Paenibacillus methanolicus]
MKQELKKQEQRQPQPMTSRERLHFLDVTRGFAMLGIILVNYFLIVDSANGYAEPTEDIWRQLVAWFGDGKFYTLFSFLFGVGFMIFMERAERQSSRPRMLFARRLTFLLLFGLLHITFIWVGDILAFYAMVGFVLFAFYKRHSRTLLIWIFALILTVAWLPFAGRLLLSDLDASASAYKADFSLVSHNMDLSYLQSIGVRWSDMSTMVATSTNTIVSMLLMFLLGMFAVQKGFFRDMEAKKRIWNRMWAVSASGFVITQASLLTGTFADPVHETKVGEIISYLGEFGGIAGSLFYMSTLAMLYLYSEKLRYVLMWLGNVGRMSMTCYLLHSTIGTFLFLGYGFGAAKGIQPVGVVAISLGVYAILLAMSTLWLKRFKYGPVEWLWRRLTYGQMK